jgi:PAS domain S-box-containing protein
MVFTDATKPDNPIIFANDSFLSLIGYDREEVLGKSFNFLMARAFALWTPPCQIVTNDLYDAPTIRRRQTTATKQLQQGSIP